MKPKLNFEKPHWLRVSAGTGIEYHNMILLINKFRVHTVCQEAHCPNQFECFSRRVATFMILGNRCTRNCSFCGVEQGSGSIVDQEEPVRVAKMVQILKLNYVVITSVTRDDLVDGGAHQFATTIRTIRGMNKKIMIEVLIPDFQGDISSLEIVLAESPAVLNHNLETVPRLYTKVRPQGDYERSLNILSTAKKISPEVVVKSGFMVGLGEQYSEVCTLLNDLSYAGCDVVTIGQYLAPSAKHYPVFNYVHPNQFKTYEDEAKRLGFLGVVAGPLIRSSYRADFLYRSAKQRTLNTC